MPALEPDEDHSGCAKTCAHCGSSNNCHFAYLNNYKKSQPRYRCLSCGNFFTHSHVDSGRPSGKKYAKTQGKELDHFEHKCLYCGAGNADTRFMYYNNRKKMGTTHPVFSCLKCDKRKYQMRLVRPEGGGDPYLEYSKPRVHDKKKNKRTLEDAFDGNDEDGDRLNEEAELDRELSRFLYESDTTGIATPPNGMELCPMSEPEMQVLDFEEDPTEYFPHIDSLMDLFSVNVDESDTTGIATPSNGMELCPSSEPEMQVPDCEEGQTKYFPHIDSILDLLSVNVDDSDTTGIATPSNGMELCPSSEPEMQVLDCEEDQKEYFPHIDSIMDLFSVNVDESDITGIATPSNGMELCPRSEPEMQVPDREEDQTKYFPHIDSILDLLSVNVDDNPDGLPCFEWDPVYIDTSPNVDEMLWA